MNRKRSKKDSPLTVRSFSSLGESTRIKSRFNSEIIHLLSRLEKKFYLIASACPNIEDIKSQVLIDFEESKILAQKLKITHPNYNNEEEGNILSQMSTDFLITFKDLRKIAVSVKYQSDLKIRNIAKLDIEKLYWNEEGVEFYLFTEQDIDKLRLRNANYLNDNYRKDIQTFIPEFLNNFKKTITDLPATMPVYQLAKLIAKQLKIEFEIVIQCIKYCILTNQISVVENVQIDSDTELKYYLI